MAKLRIDLQEGFQNDEVVVTIDGEERLRRAGVNTKRVLGLAGSQTLEVDDGARSIEFSVPSRGVTKHVDLDAHDSMYVGLSLTDGTVAVRVREKPFGYG